MRNHARALGEELARLNKDVLSPGIWPEQFSGSRQDSGGDPLSEAAGEQECLDVPGGTQAGDFCWFHGPRLSAAFLGAARCRDETSVIVLPTADGESQ